MDSNLITTLAAAISPVVIAITALILSNKRIDRVELSMDGLRNELKSDFSSLRSEFKAEFAEIRTSLDMLNGSMKELDKRLSIIEDREARH